MTQDEVAFGVGIPRRTDIAADALVLWLSPAYAVAEVRGCFLQTGNRIMLDGPCSADLQADGGLAPRPSRAPSPAYRDIAVKPIALQRA